MKRLLCLLFLFVPVIALQAQIQIVTSAQKQEALNKVTAFCNLLSMWCEGQRTLDKDIYSMCTGRDISAFDDIKTQKETTLQNYILAIQRNYSKSLKMDITQPSLSNAKIYYCPKLSFSEKMGTTDSNQYNPLSQNYVFDINAESYENAFISFTIRHSISSGASSERTVIYDVNAGKISAYVKGDGTYTSFLKGLEYIVNRDYRKAIPCFKYAMENQRASLKTQCSYMGLACCMYSQEFDAAEVFTSYLKDPLWENYCKGMSFCIKENWKESLSYLLECEAILNSSNKASGVAQGVYGALFTVYSMPIEEGGLLDRQKAVHYARLAIKNGAVYIPFVLLTLYYLDEEYEDYIGEELFSYLEWAANQGHTGAILMTGRFAEVKDKTQEARQWYEKGAKAGDALCMAYLGRILVRDDSTRSLGLEWLRKSLADANIEEQIVTYSFISKDSFWPQNRRQIQELIDKYQYISPSISNNYTIPSTSSTSLLGNSSSSNSNATSYSSPSNLYSKHHYSSFNDAKDEYNGGLSFAYVQKQWEYKSTDGHVEKYGVFSDDGESKYVQGVQMGIRYEPQFDHGFGMNTGVFFEYYWDKSDKYDGIYGKWNEISAYVPLDLEFRMNFSKHFQLFMYGGISIDCGIYANMSFYDSYFDDELIEEEENVYSNDEYEMHRFNFSYEYGGGFRCNNVQLQFHLSKGLIDMAVSDADYRVKQNKPMTISLSFMF